MKKNLTGDKSKKRQSYTDEQKASAQDLYVLAGVTNLQELSALIDIPYKTLRNWKARKDEEGKDWEQKRLDAQQSSPLDDLLTTCELGSRLLRQRVVLAKATQDKGFDMNDVSRSMTRLARINKDLLAQQVLLTHFQIVKVLRMITTYCREQTGQGVTKQEADITMKVLNQFLDGLSLPQK